MPRTFFATAMLTMAQANKIVYRPDVDVDQYRVDPSMYPMSFKWPEGDFRCGATMISPTMALTAAHCIGDEEINGDPNLNVVLSDGQTYGIKEFRPNDCWNFSTWGPLSADIAIMVLDRPIENAVAGTHYADIWDASTMGDVVGKEFTLVGWGGSGELREDGSTNHHVTEIFHRGYNVVDEIKDGMLIYDFDRPGEGLALEAMGAEGDSGSAAFIDVNGTLIIAGVNSNEKEAIYGTKH